ncbi:type II toxin-antitoxin system death-on-curing family toxin (plasmid) [Carnobacterium maltaromaticum]|uniref:type II toxin-antitoxin system death-on-curing family toxin n=1 Tax=Carnobacterium maltaromaticum TaxID=2751 RepID=UPI00344CF898
MVKYLSDTDLIKINTYLIVTFSPKEIQGVKDSKILQMIVKQPQQEVFEEELYPTIIKKAGILLINIATKHAFHNANKRTAWTATIVFLDINGYKTEFPEEIGIDLVMNIATWNNENKDNLKESLQTFDDLKKHVFNFLKSSPYIKQK